MSKPKAYKDLSNRQRVAEIIKLAEQADDGELHPCRRLERILKLATDLREHRKDAWTHGERDPA